MFQTDEWQPIDNLGSIDQFIDIEIANTPFCSECNRVVAERNDGNAVRGQEVCISERCDLIPKLVSAPSNPMVYETETSILHEFVTELDTLYS